MPEKEVPVERLPRATRVRALHVLGTANGTLHRSPVPRTTRPLYQSIVRRSPSERGVRDFHPKSSSARVTSSFRRGWPLGRDVSHRISPAYPVSCATRLANSRIEISSPEPRLTGAAPSYRSRSEERRVGK